MATYSKLLTLALLAVMGLSACRKKIDIDHYNEPPTEATWQRISPSFCEELYALEVYKNKLYFGGDFYTDYGAWGNMGWYNDADSSFGTWNFSYDGTGGVYDLQLFNNRLYAAGDFDFQGTQSSHLSMLYLNNAETQIPVNVANFFPITIYGLGIFNDSLVLTGNFYQIPSNTPNINTTNIELLTTSNVLVGAADASAVLHGSCEHNSELYVCGENGYFAYFTGNSWGVIDYPGKTSSDRIFDIVSLGNTIVLVGKFTGGTVIRTFNTTTGIWNASSDIITETNIGHGAGFKKIGSDLYVFGNDMESATAKYTNIFHSTDGLNWQPVGEIREEVRDVALYESYLYAATKTGLYCLKK